MLCNDFFFFNLTLEMSAIFNQPTYSGLLYLTWAEVEMSFKSSTTALIAQGLKHCLAFNGYYVNL